MPPRLGVDAFVGIHAFAIVAVAAALPCHVDCWRARLRRSDRRRHAHAMPFVAMNE